jgi:predicted deacylase
MAVDTPVLVVNGAHDGPTLCLTAAVHGDELNGIEMVRRILYDLDPHKLHGTIIGVPIVNLLGFTRNSRYLPDRRDLNRYFPGNPNGSVASRIANAFFEDVVKHCDSLVDLHTGSFYRTNIPQLRADMNNPKVADFVEMFGDIPVLNSHGNSRSLRAAAVRAGIPTVTLEAGEPMRLQRDMVDVGVKTIYTLLAKSGMYSRLGLWVKPEPAFYDSAWVRTNGSGILLSRMELGDEVKKGDILGAVSNPITNEQLDIVSPYKGRILGMALDQFVIPGYAVYHIGIHAAKDTIKATGSELEVDGPVDGTGEFDDRDDMDDMQDRAQMPGRNGLDADTYEDE